MIHSRSLLEDSRAMELGVYGARQFGIKEYPSRASWGSLLLKIETRSYYEDILGIYGSSGISYGGLSRGGCEAYLVTLTTDALSSVFLVNAGP